MVGYRDPQVGSQPSETVRQTMVGGLWPVAALMTSPSSRSACGVVMSSLTWPNFCRLEDIRRHCTDEVSQSS